MKPEDVARSYDAIAERWARPQFIEANGIEQHRRALRFVPSRGVALEVGCGASGRLRRLLEAHGLVVEGLDISPEMLRWAKQAHPAATFYHGDVCSWIPSKPYAFISAWDSIWHVPLEQQRAVMLKLFDALTPEGVMIFTAGGLPQAGAHTNEAMGVPMYHATLGVPGILDAVREANCALRHFEYDQWPEVHVYVVVQKEATSALA